ncbi:MAG TPA: hypothetical protein VE988_13655 [Gemmataceae bacterium]|nr:hypothetical protein [Gemmataceae bacterium]
MRRLLMCLIFVAGFLVAACMSSGKNHSVEGVLTELAKLIPVSVKAWTDDHRAKLASNRQSSIKCYAAQQAAVTSW